MKLLNPFRQSHSLSTAVHVDTPIAYSENRGPNNLTIIELFQSQGCNSVSLLPNTRLCPQRPPSCSLFGDARP